MSGILGGPAQPVILVDQYGNPTTSLGGSGTGGDASAANQTTEITKLTSIDGKTPALGQALAAASTPVVLTAAQLASLTAPVLAAGTNNIGDVDVLTNVHPAALGLAGTGELIGVTSATVLPTLTCKYVRLKARATNPSYVYVGGSGVTAGDGTTDTTTGFELAAGDDTGWIPVTNLNLLYRICTTTSDHLTYMALV